MKQLEPARPEDIEICAGIIDMGRAFQRAQGFVQWTEDYPSRDTLLEDMRTGKGYVLRVDGAIAGYMCIDFGGEPAYREIEGAWKTEEPYAVVHRMAFDSRFRGMGLADAAFHLIEALCVERGMFAIRIDTDFPNERMQHILKKNGFASCGVVVFQGSGKLAFEKQLG